MQYTSINMRKVICMPGFVLVKPKPETEGNIILPDQVQKNKNRAEVVAVATDSKLMVIGDIIFVRDYIDKPLLEGEDTLFFVEEADVLGRENNGKAV